MIALFYWRNDNVSKHRDAVKTPGVMLNKPSEILIKLAEILNKRATSTQYTPASTRAAINYRIRLIQYGGASRLAVIT